MDAKINKQKLKTKRIFLVWLEIKFMC
jgi:hypothetical protein